MTHRPNAITHTQKYTVLPGVVWHTFIIFGLITTLNLCPLTQNPGDATEGSDHLQLINGRPAPPGRGSAARRKFLARPYYSQLAVFAPPLSAFFISVAVRANRKSCRLSASTSPKSLASSGHDYDRLLGNVLSDREWKFIFLTIVNMRGSLTKYWHI